MGSGEQFERALSFIDATKDVADADSLSERFASAVGEFGYDYFACTSFCSDAKLPPKAVLLLNYPTDWLQHYHTRDYKREDRILEVAATHALPFEWSEPMVRDAATSGQLRILNEGGEAGLVHGMTIPVYSTGFLPATVNLAGTKIDDDPSIPYAVQLMSIYLHNKAVMLREQETEQAIYDVVTLTSRERQCLHWVAEGKSDTVIADILEISSSTVHFHIENAKKKYGVATRIQAVLRAFLEGQLII